jgi:hypothetical protein
VVGIKRCGVVLVAMVIATATWLHALSCEEDKDEQKGVSPSVVNGYEAKRGWA